jgi:hypothetical protein
MRKSLEEQVRVQFGEKFDDVAYALMSGNFRVISVERSNDGVSITNTIELFMDNATMELKFDMGSRF